MKKPLIALLFILAFLAPHGLRGQGIPLADSLYPCKDRYVFRFIPSLACNIYGIALGPVGSEAICNLQRTRKSHGINLQIPGQGIFQTFHIRGFRLENLQKETGSDSIPERVQHNGLLISLTGTFSERINGISLSGWMSRGNIVNGVSINPLWNLYRTINGISIGVVNHSLRVRGVQIGIYNKTTRLQGIQTGLWNVNDKRALPLINWSNGKAGRKECTAGK